MPREQAKPESNQVNAILADGNSHIQVDNTYYLSEDRCLVDLCSTDPRDDKTRIEQTKGGLLRGSYK